MTREVAFITVNYRSPQATALLVADLCRQRLPDVLLTIVVADNSPSPPELRSLMNINSREAQVKILSDPSNPGYFGAAHGALKTMWNDNPPDWVIVSNPDIRLPDNHVLERIVNTDRAAAVIAPRIIAAQCNVDQNPYQETRPPKCRIQLDRIIFRVPALYWLMEKRCSVKRAVKATLASGNLSSGSRRTIYAPHGSFIIFNRRYFDRGGNLNVGTFLYAEEAFVAETCRRIGEHVLYDPSIVVVHNEHVCTANHPRIRELQLTAKDYIYREFFSNRGKTSGTH